MNAEQGDEVRGRACMIVAHSDETYAALIGRSFRRLGWDTYTVRTGPEARRMTRMLQPEVLVMGTDLEGETGWLTCDKVKRDLPGVKVFLIGDATNCRNQAFASFLGAAALLDSADSIQILVEEVCGRTTLPAAG